MSIRSRRSGANSGRQLWDPHTGETNAVGAVEYVKKGGQDYMKFALNLKGVTSTFVVGDALPLSQDLPRPRWKWPWRRFSRRRPDPTTEGSRGRDPLQLWPTDTGLRDMNHWSQALSCLGWQ